MISMGIRDDVSRRLRALARQVGDTRVPNKALAVQMQSWALRNFDSSGGKVGGWAPLAPSTLKEKARKGYSPKPLLRTGHLRTSLLAFFDDRRAGLGSELEIAEYHEEGVPENNLPARRMLPEREEAYEMGIQVYGHHIARARARAAL